MIKVDGDRIIVRLEGTIGDGLVEANHVAITFAVFSRLYRTIRLFQAVFEQNETLALVRRPSLVGRWYVYSMTGLVRPSPRFRDLTEWIGDLAVEHVESGSIESVLKALGGGVGEGIGRAVQGTAIGIVTILTAPAEFRRRWAIARRTNADARIREARAAAEEAKASLLDWSENVLRGTWPSTPIQFVAALDVQVQAGNMSRRFANQMVRRLSDDVALIANLGERKVLAP